MDAIFYWLGVITAVSVCISLIFLAGLAVGMSSTVF